MATNLVLSEELHEYTANTNGVVKIVIIEATVQNFLETVLENVVLAVTDCKDILLIQIPVINVFIPPLS